MFDKDLSREEISLHTSTYLVGIYSEAFNMKKILLCILKSLNHSVILFFFLLYSSHSITADGKTEDLFTTGTALYISVVLTVNFLVILEMHEFYVPFLLVIIITSGLIFPFLLIYDTEPLKFIEFSMIGVLKIL